MVKPIKPRERICFWAVWAEKVAAVAKLGSFTKWVKFVLFNCRKHTGYWVVTISYDNKSREQQQQLTEEGDQLIGW